MQDHPVIWMRPEHGTRGPKPAHGRRDVAAAAVRIADAEGIDAVSMRRIAAELGTGTTSLYRYVSKKDDVLELMGDEVLGELRDTTLPDGWRPGLCAIACLLRETALRHPWLPSLASGRANHGPNSLWWSELTLSVFDGLDLDTDEMLATLGTLSAFVLGHVLGELGDREAARRSGLTHEQWMDQQGEYGPAIMGSGRYPRLTRVMIEAQTPHAADRQDRLFEAGLERVLDGLAAHLPRN
ncbi:TetR/AcrR family transcriptional regulator [Amycolatopsis vancoresmycina]|uniref:TetR family transcriptional regulator n=1 Tax=Amycolatopsis vancoresmycina DSM 44592 TaxID=1292037 RepID=R1HYA9_9PSEU|nr:TetR/AcrR family transcriptional regulator [Amycolatopsis vancoresmycina]EOD63264.1 TetR family transcriptional regulator [Amycolatopsis vancoresmycina DSM 44592]